ncbi:MAG: hypothetical protein RR400_01110 [Clostridia bacterium]
MELKIWSKTILSSYKYLKRICCAIDKLVDAEAESSARFYSSNSSSYNSFAIASNMIDYTEKKIALINVKLLTEKVLASIDAEQARLLIKKFINCDTSEKIYSYLGITERTYFRKLNLALSSFEKNMQRLGYSAEKLGEMLNGQKWILSVYDRIEKEQQDKGCKKSSLIDCLDGGFLGCPERVLSKVSLFN